MATANRYRASLRRFHPAPDPILMFTWQNLSPLDTERFLMPSLRLPPLQIIPLGNILGGLGADSPQGYVCPDRFG